MTHILFAWDHAGVDYIAPLNHVVKEMGYEIVNLGPVSREPVDYPDYTAKLVDAFLAGQGQYG
ncbi:RpiB/LacA/LacB family sugar-phosphate isomerase, partial [Acinetobacter baumannii]